MLGKLQPNAIMKCNIRLKRNIQKLKDKPSIKTLAKFYATFKQTIKWWRWIVLFANSGMTSSHTRTLHNRWQYVIVDCKGATAFSKLGVQFLGLGYYTEQNMDGIPSFVHCSVLCNDNHTLHQKSWGGPSKFWVSGPPTPVVAPLVDWVKVLHPTLDKMGHSGDALPSQSLC